MIVLEIVIIDVKLGILGGGWKVNINMLLVEVDNFVGFYGVVSYRYILEIE